MRYPEGDEGEDDDDEEDERIGKSPRISAICQPAVAFRRARRLAFFDGKTSAVWASASLCAAEKKCHSDAE